MKHIALTLMTLALLSTVAYADTPLPPPHAETVCSPSERICATIDPADGTTVAHNQATKSLLWSLAGWHRRLFVADGGNSAVVGYDGQNLPPLNAQLSQPVLGFYRKGGSVRVVTLGELYKQLTDIPRTESHLAWVPSVGFNKHNQFELTLPEGRHITFSLIGQRMRAAASGTLLNKCSNLVKPFGHTSDDDVFGDSNSCSRWRKRSAV